MLLDTGRISIGMTRLGKVARKTIFGNGGAVSEADMVAIVGFVGTGHLQNR